MLVLLSFLLTVLMVFFISEEPITSQKDTDIRYATYAGHNATLVCHIQPLSQAVGEKVGDTSTTLSIEREANQIHNGEIFHGEGNYFVGG